MKPQRAAVTAARKEFPLLESCVYLNSNATGAFPRGMEAVLADYWKTLASWRDEVWERWWRELHEYWDEVAAFIGAPPGSVVTDGNISSLVGRVLTCFDFEERPRIVTSDLEFPSMNFVLGAFERHGAEVVTIPSRDGFSIDAERLLESIDQRTQIVCVSHATYSTGALLDLEPIAERAHEMGALLLVDAYASVGTVPVDVRHVDLMVGGARKWLCGAHEAAFLYARPSLALSPAATGWVASADPLSFGPAKEYAASARRFASGTPAVLPALTSRVGLRILREVGIEEIRAASLRRTARIIERADAAGLGVFTPREPERRGGIVTLRFEGDRRVQAALLERGIITSYRSGLRIGPHFFNTDEEVEQCMDALTSLARRPS